ncbi:MAG TPA: hypothetical protein PKY05_17655, partial [Fibrobacteria bacterium]|nr:hypothetical protein [Fibrobacteria bacterium]
MRRFLAVFLAVPMAARSTDLIKFESGKAALARDVNENFTRLDTAIQARATKGDLASLDAQIQVVRSIQSDSIQVISERIRRDSIALADFKAKIRKDSAATSADVKALQTTVTGLGSGGLPASAVAGKANSVAKFTGANAVGNSSLTDDGTNLSTAANLNVAGGSLKLSNASTNLLEFASVGLGLPTFGTRAKGAKVVWFGGLGATSTEYATGVNNYTLWNSVPMADADHNFAWYAGQTPVMTLKGVGTLDVASDI